MPVTGFTGSVWGIHDAQAEDIPLPTGCGWFRVKLPLDQLKAHGWKVRYQAFTPPPEVAGYKLIAAERLDRPHVLGMWRRFRARHRLAYEIDDDVWHVDPVNFAAYSIFSRDSVRDTVEMCIAIADVVTVTCQPLAEVIRTQTGHPNIKVIPNYIPASLLTTQRPRREHVTIGWMGGMSHAMDMALIAAPLRRVLDTNRNLRGHIVGTDYRKTVGHTHIRHTGWEPIPADVYQHMDFDIGLCPLQPTTFNESKSALKAMEYGALGIPVVASDFGPYHDYVIDGVTGFLVSNPKQWRERIRELAADGDLRESMGSKAREQASGHTIEEHWVKWAAAYQEVLQ